MNRRRILAELPDERIAAPGAVEVVRVTDLANLQGRFAWLAEEYAERQPILAVLHEGEAVSVCCSSRNAPEAAEAGLRTLEGYQRRGYAAAVVLDRLHPARKARLPLVNSKNPWIATGLRIHLPGL